MAPMNDNNGEEDFLKPVKKMAHSRASNPIKWRQCVDNQSPPLVEYWYCIQTPELDFWSW